LRQELGDPAICAEVVPPLIELESEREHLCACHFRGPGAQPIPTTVATTPPATAPPATAQP